MSGVEIPADLLPTFLAWEAQDEGNGYYALEIIVLEPVNIPSGSGALQTDQTYTYEVLHELTGGPTWSKLVKCNIVLKQSTSSPTPGPTIVLPSVACKLAWESWAAELKKEEAAWYQKLSSLQGTHIPIYYGLFSGETSQGTA